MAYGLALANTDKDIKDRINAQTLNVIGRGETEAGRRKADRSPLTMTSADTTISMPPVTPETERRGGDSCPEICSPSHREAPICAAGVKKLRDDGWRVVCEVWQWSRPIDAVAERSGQVLAMESKTGLTKKLKHQIRWNLSADLLVAIVGTRPREEGLAWCREHKIGLWLVTENVVTELVQPQLQNPDNYHRKILLDALEQYERAGDTTPGGLPCQKGVGIAQWVQAAVDEYRADHQKATWKEIHANVPSHYRTHQNMYSALHSNGKRLAFRKRMKARRMEND
jgi:hypothetical protein